MRITYGIDDLTLNTIFSNDTLRFFAVKYKDFILLSMRFKANTALNSTAFTSIITGLPTISWSQPLTLLNTTSQERGIVKCIYTDSGGITLITNANENYLNAGDEIFIGGIVMI